MRNKIILGAILVFAVLQLFRIEKVEHQEITTDDFLKIESPSEEVVTIMKASCLNCHTNRIDYPWYSEIAPVSWWIADHIEEGREHLNFSEWGLYSDAKKEHKAEESWEEVEEKEMPLESYAFMHSEANLSDEEREVLIKFFKKIQLKYKIKAS